MAKTSIWMPLYTRDYRADTAHLTTEQHGAYLLLIMTCWECGGSLPTNIRQLATITGLSPVRFQRNVWPVLKPLFLIREDRIEHNRVSRELASAHKNREKKRGAAQKRWASYESATHYNHMNSCDFENQKPSRGDAPPDPPKTTDNNDIGYADAYAHAYAEPMQNVCPSPTPKVSKKDNHFASLRGRRLRAANDPPVEQLDLQPGNVVQLNPERDVIAAWNAMAVGTGLRQCRVLNPSRRALVRRRIIDAGGMVAFLAALERVKRSKFLCGFNDRGWCADIDWLLKARNFTRLTEGIYDDREPPEDEIAQMRREMGLGTFLHGDDNAPKAGDGS